MILEKQPYWNKLVDHYYDNVKWEKNIDNIYDWLEQEYDAVSSTSDVMLKFNDEKKAMWFVMKWS